MPAPSANITCTIVDLSLVVVMFGDVTRVAPVAVFVTADPSMGLLVVAPLKTATIQLTLEVEFVVAVNSVSSPVATLKNTPAFKSGLSELSTNKSAKSGSKFVTDIS